MKDSIIKTHVFISYARSDAAEVANLLQRRLESYRIPRKLVGKGVPLPNGKYLRRVFVDTEDLSVSKKSFHAHLKQELDDAKFLIVFCSRAAARADSFAHKEIKGCSLKFEFVTYKDEKGLGFYCETKNSVAVSKNM